ncbi:putative ribonuclease H-like domain-containing protein [Tanacetum coccineum]|uniref:Ribonuclease H-like domain-containing protein n=1 Tax=Tanacetum coccineum TaxID=301880 RepID=A0ABQ4ZER0_9ASTR
MDVKRAFLYGKFEEEVYVCQPPRFKDPNFPDRVYKVEKALYGLNQAPRAWYETLSTYMLDNGFQRGEIDKTLFIKRDKSDILLISWQCKKQIVVANSTTEAEYVAASSCCGQVLWIQNQLLDYGYSNEKKLIQMIKIYTDKNVADLLTKAFDSDLVSKITERNGELKNRKRGIEVNAGNSKLMLLGINLILLGINLLLLLKINAARHNLLLLLKGNAARHKLTTVGEREIFKLEDVEGVDCLPNAAIFEQLTLMGYEKLSQKLTFYKAFFPP